ncbi:MAG TPA: hypothetical protein VGQ47_03175 [Candidatus Limnocylindrales bacterium]|nr:hypothetical protein [Candidatus Limnocylindrales bacterium]
MAERALPPGAYRRRALFGLLDADGWTWATLKATFWFVAIIFLLGYLPDRAYYFTVFPTIDVGANIISPVNFCDPLNRTLPCPAPPGSVVPWDESPEQLALPEPRAGAATFQSGTSLYLVGGASGEAATDSVLATTVTTTGNFAPWDQAPALPEPRSGAALASFSGVPYLIGGLDADGKPADTVFVGTIEEGALTGWAPSDDLRLPVPLADSGVVSAANGIWLLGGRGDGDVLSPQVYLAKLDTSVQPAQITTWKEVEALPLPEARAGAVTVLVNRFIYILGGQAPNGPTNTILRLQLDQKGEPVTTGGRGWATSEGGQSLPEARAGASGFTANGALYVIGGDGPTGQPTRSTLWAIPNTTSGNIPEWRRLDQTDLPKPRAHGAVAVVGSFVFIIGGEDERGPVDSTLRANQAPKPPFFRLGLFGATLPALSIKGEIGQQLGYINAFGLGVTNFTILVLIGYAFSHRRQSRALLSRLTRGRVRPPRDEQYFDPNRPTAAY